MRSAVVYLAHQEGDEKGSWSITVSDAILGRVGATALLAATMVTYYRYPQEFTLGEE